MNLVVIAPSPASRRRASYCESQLNKAQRMGLSLSQDVPVAEIIEGLRKEKY